MSLCGGDSAGSPYPLELVEEYIKEQEQLFPCNIPYQYSSMQSGFRTPSHCEMNSPHHYSDSQSGFTSDESCDPPSPTDCSPMWSSGNIPDGYPSMQQGYITEQSAYPEVPQVNESSFQPPQLEHSNPISTSNQWLNAEYCDINDMANWAPKSEITSDCSVISFPPSYVVVGFSATQKDRKWNTNLSQDRCQDFSENVCPRDNLSSPEPSLSENEGSPEPLHTRPQQHHLPTKKRNNKNSLEKGPVRKGLQLWQFLLEVLQDDRYNPDLIKWVNADQGIFKFIQSQKVAKLWGQKRAKNNMSYEYLSRALRYYYSRGIMRRIAGKRLVYQFGPNAYGWENSFMTKQMKV